MRKILLSLSALLFIVIMAISCKKQNTPKDAATTWLNSFYHMDYETAKTVSTEETKTLISQLQQLSSMISDSSKKELKKINIVVKDVKENGDKATVTYALSDNPTKDQPLELVKKDGKWLVQFSKNDQMGGGANSGGGADTTGVPADATMDSTGAAK